MTQLTGVSRTLLLTLRSRAEEHLRRDRLFADELALKWYRALPRDRRLEQFYNAGGQNLWSIRAHFFDEMTRQHLAGCDRPLVVELGAGLSTRYYRLQSSKVDWIELDLPEVMAVRRQLDRESDRHQFMEFSILDFTWMDALPHRNPEEILFLSEGLLMYLQPAGIERLVKEMRSRFAGAIWGMDAIGKTAKIAGQTLQTIQAPFRWYVDDERDIAKMGLSILTLAYPLEVCPRRWPCWLQLFSSLPIIRKSYFFLKTQL